MTTTLRAAPRDCRAVLYYSRSKQRFQATLEDRYGVFATGLWKKSVAAAKRAIRGYSRWRGWRLRWNPTIHQMP